MRKQQAIIALREQCDAVKALGVTSLYLFGSTVHDAAGAASDLDIFVDYDRDSRFSLIELVGIGVPARLLALGTVLGATPRVWRG